MIRRFISQRLRNIPPQVFLDTYSPNLKAAFSTVQILSTSTQCLRLRRSSDNIEQDFGFLNGVVDSVAISTFLGGADGYVKIWYDQSGNSKHATQTVNTKQPKLLLNSLNTRAELSFDGVDDFLITPSLFDSSFDNSFSSFTLANKLSDSFRLHDGSADSKYYGSRDGSNTVSKVANYNKGGASPATIGAVAYLNTLTQQMLEGYTYDGLSRRFYINNTLYKSLATTGAYGTSGALTIGSLANGGGFFWDGTISTKLYLNSALSTADVKIVGNKIKNDYKLNKKRYLFFEGNSLTAGVGASTTDAYPGLNYPSRVVAEFGGTQMTDFYNGGGLGARTIDLITRDTPDNGVMRVQTNGFADRQIALVWEGSNSMSTGSTAISAYNDMVTLLTFIKSLGYKVILFTVIVRGSYAPGSGVTEASFEAERLTYNQLLRDNADSLCDYLVDIGVDTILGDVTKYNDLTWFTDKIHLTDVGYERVANAAIPIVRQIFNEA